MRIIKEVKFVIYIFSSLMLFVDCNSKSSVNTVEAYILSTDKPSDSTPLIYDYFCNNKSKIKADQKSSFFVDSTFFTFKTDTLKVSVKKRVLLKGKTYQEVKIFNTKTLYFKKFLRHSDDKIFEFSLCDSSDHVFLSFIEKEKETRKCIDVQNDLDILYINDFNKCGFIFHQFSINSFKSSHINDKKTSIGLFIVEKKYGVIGIGMTNDKTNLDVFYLTP
jgi:hypothetical protein